MIHLYFGSLISINILLIAVNLQNALDGKDSALYVVMFVSAVIGAIATFWFTTWREEASRSYRPSKLYKKNKKTDLINKRI